MMQIVFTKDLPEKKLRSGNCMEEVLCKLKKHDAHYTESGSCKCYQNKACYGSMSLGNVVRGPSVTWKGHILFGEWSLY